jgi:hypothetical protein
VTIQEPEALAKAESLWRFAQASGSPLSTFALALSHQDAMDLLSFYEAQFGHVELFVADVAEARLTDNPWPVLANFELFGFQMVPVETLH